jgi:hypothetical protein
MASQHAFVVMQIGEQGTPERKRADEIYQFVVTPVLAKLGITAYRADLDPTPGQITPQMLRKLLDAQVVIADLTGRNPNVFYELGVIHSFARPVVALADSAKSLPFDTHDERVIEIGEYREVLGVPQAEEAKTNLQKALEVVLSPGYEPASPLAEAAANRSLDELAPENPVAAELSAIREALEEVRKNIRPRSVTPPSTRAQIDSMRGIIETLVSEGRIAEEELEGLVNDNTPQSFDDWVEARKYEAREKQASWTPRAASRAASSGGQFNDEPPF